MVVLEVSDGRSTLKYDNQRNSVIYFIEHIYIYIYIYINMLSL
jgi:hypothetical protein